MTPTEAMIFAAGFGTRMGKLTASTPKPLLPFRDGRLIDLTLNAARDAGVTRFVANAHYLAEQVTAYLEPKGCRVAVETPDILDTGGGLKAAADCFGGDAIFTANPDAVWNGPNPFQFLGNAWDDTVDALLLCVDVDAALGRDEGDFRVDRGHAYRGGGLVYGGVQILRLDPVRAHPERVFSLNAVWDTLLANGRLSVLRYPGMWCDVGTPDGLVAAENMVSDDA